jgi:hypothetical protein
MVTVPAVVIITLLVLDVAPVKLMAYPPAGAVSVPVAQVNTTGPEKAVTELSAVMALANDE